MCLQLATEIKHFYIIVLQPDHFLVPFLGINSHYDFIIHWKYDKCAKLSFKEHYERTLMNIIVIVFSLRCKILVLNEFPNWPFLAAMPHTCTCIALPFLCFNLQWDMASIHAGSLGHVTNYISSFSCMLHYWKSSLFQWITSCCQLCLQLLSSSHHFSPSRLQGDLI